jgi:hypothetical protein
MSSNNFDAGENQDEDEAGKSQRKRERERQRRSEMAGAFNDLAQLLQELDPDNADSMSISRRRKRRGSDGDDFDATGDASGMTRLLLINRATEMLRNLRADNNHLRQRLQMTGGVEDKVRLLNEIIFRASASYVLGVFEFIGQFVPHAEIFNYLFTITTEYLCYVANFAAGR